MTGNLMHNIYCALALAFCASGCTTDLAMPHPGYYHGTSVVVSIPGYPGARQFLFDIDKDEKVDAIMNTESHIDYIADDYRPSRKEAPGTIDENTQVMDQELRKTASRLFQANKMAGYSFALDRYNRLRQHGIPPSSACLEAAAPPDPGAQPGKAGTQKDKGT